jgi:hypothetical protein
MCTGTLSPYLCLILVLICSAPASSSSISYVLVWAIRLHTEQTKHGGIVLAGATQQCSHAKSLGPCRTAWQQSQPSASALQGRSWHGTHSSSTLLSTARLLKALPTSSAGAQPA